MTDEPDHTLERMQILVLGGTQFLGRHVVDAALEREHAVTLFNRGRTRPELYPDVEKLRGDRDGDLAALAGRSFDAVVDTSGYVPRVVSATLDALTDVGHYTFVSSVSVYAVSRASGRRGGADARCWKRRPRTTAGPAYAPLKALCEHVVRTRFPAAFIVRAPPCSSASGTRPAASPTWPQRFLDAGPVLAPSPPSTQPHR